MVMGWLKGQNTRQLDKTTVEGDAVCTIAVRRPDSNRVVEKLSSVRQWVKLINSSQPQQSDPSSTLQQQQHRPRASQDVRVQLVTNLAELPDTAAFVVWQLLPQDARNSLLLVSSIARKLFARCVRSLHLCSVDIRKAESPEILGRLHEVFPGLNELHLHTSSDFDCHAAQCLKRSQLPVLHTIHIDSKMQHEVFHAVAKFVVQCPHLRVLQLPNQRCSSSADQRILATVLEAALGLTELDLGGSVYVSSSGVSNAISNSTFRRITHLYGLSRLAINASLVPDSSLAALAHLPALEFLSISACGSGAGLAAALPRLSKLTSLELQHPDVRDALVGSLVGLSQLQVLALGLCPKLSDGILAEVCELKKLQKVTLPFALRSNHLRLLSRLPQLQELYSWRYIELEVLGPSHNSLDHVKQLVCHSIHGNGKQLAAWFPNLGSAAVKHCDDMAALSLRGCVGLQTLLAGDCAQMSNEGFACLKMFKALQRLQLEGAEQISDAAFAAVFSSTMPALQQISLAGCPSLSDRGMQLLTASCRRLSSIAISSCRLLTDKTLKRLAHCEHLTTVSLKGCRGFTAEGVLALAAAPQMKSVTVAGCSSVIGSLCKAHRPGVKVRVYDKV